MVGLHRGADFDEVLGVDPELRDLRLGSTLATANWPRSALVMFFDLTVPAPSCSAS